MLWLYVKQAATQDSSVYVYCLLTACMVQFLLVQATGKEIAHIVIIRMKLCIVVHHDMLKIFTGTGSAN